MDSTTKKKYLYIQELARSDSVYKQLIQEFLTYDKQILDLFTRLKEQDAALLIDYLGVFSAIEKRLLELACINLNTPNRQK